MRLLAPISDFLDRVGPSRGEADPLTVGKAAAVGLGAGLLAVFDLADKVAGLLSDNKALRYHVQSIAVFALLVLCISIYTATTPGGLLSQREYRHPKPLRTVAKAGLLLVVLLVLRIVHELPSTHRQTYSGYLCDQRGAIVATSVTVKSVFDRKIGTTSTIGSDGSFACTVPAWTYRPSVLASEGACTGTVDLSESSLARGCDGDGELLPVWRMSCDKY